VPRPGQGAPTANAVLLFAWTATRTAGGGVCLCVCVGGGRQGVSSSAKPPLPRRQWLKTAAPAPWFMQASFEDITRHRFFNR
jgi:hypothetical protein